jgi:regulator of protease activity HflC (stomatin/prohibitin superfamily)
LKGKKKYELIMRVPLLVITGFAATGIILLFIAIRMGYLAPTFRALFNPLNWAWFISLVMVPVLFYECWREIPARPPHVGLVTIRGERIPKILPEGWYLFWPFPPFWYSAITVNVEKKNVDFTPKNVRTADKAELIMEISVTYSPNTKKPRALIDYMNAGGSEKINDILDDIIRERIRLFAIKKSWTGALEAGEEVIKHLIQEITGAKTDVDIDKIRKGNGVAEIPGLGIILHRLNIGTVWLKGKLAEKAETEAVEIREREAEKVELAHVKEEAEKMKEIGLSPKDAVEVVQTEREKVSKTITEFKGLEGIGGLPLINIKGETPPRAKKRKKKARKEK